MINKLNSNTMNDCQTSANQSRERQRPVFRFARPRSTSLFASTFTVCYLLVSTANTLAETVRISGSERMVPLLKKLADAYSANHPDTKFEISGGGTNVAITALSLKRTDVAALARSANDDEFQRIARALKKDAVGVPIAMDAVVFTVNKSNPLDQLTMDTVRKIWLQEVSRWTELGLRFEDKQEIVRYGLDTQSGSRGVLDRRGCCGMGVTSAIQSKANNALVTDAVAVSSAAIGFCGMGDFKNVKPLPIKVDENKPPVLPTVESIQSREYPFAHYLYLYFAGLPTGETAEFVAFIVGPKGQQIISESGTGVVPLPLKSAESQRDASK